MRKISYFLLYLLTPVTLAVAGIIDTNELEIQKIIKIECEAIPMLDRPQTIHSFLKENQNSNQSNHPHTPEFVRQSVPHMKLKHNSSSTNWSGYAAYSQTNAKNSVTDVFGEWIVPRMVSNGGTGYCSTWVGIDGFSSNSVEQIGTEQDWNPSNPNNPPNYYAWFEMYPGPSYWLKGFPVNAGDLIAGEVSYVGNNKFKLTLINYTQRTFTSTITVTTSTSPSRSSAEWVVEAPSSNQGVLPLADYQTVTFTNCSATIKNVTGSINNSHWTNIAITMITTNSIPKSVPSNLSSNGTAFTTTWYHN